MKRLILVRHGNYSGSSLSAYGRLQMQELAPTLIKSVVGNMLLVSSSIRRAVESAAILGEYFRVPLTTHEAWAAPGDTSDNDGAYQFISVINPGIDTLIVVTHLPFLESFPKYFGQRALGVTLPYGGVDKGQAQVIDCELKTMTRVIPSPMEKADTLPTQLTPPIPRASERYTTEHAERYVAILKRVTPANRLRKVYVFGSIAKHGSGNDVDLVLEVPRNVFLEFATSCVGALDGFHPVTAQLLPCANACWNYESPKTARAEYALSTLAVPPGVSTELAKIVPQDKIDILCLPIGWRDKTDVNQVLHKAFGFGKDRNLLKNIIESAIELH